MVKDLLKKTPTPKAHAFAAKRAKRFNGIAGKVGGLAVGAAALFGGTGQNKAVADVFMAPAAQQDNTPMPSDNMTTIFKSFGEQPLVTKQLAWDFNEIYFKTFKEPKTEPAARAVESLHKVAKDVITPFNDALKKHEIDETIVIDSRRLTSNAIDIGRVFGYGDDSRALLNQLRTHEGRTQFEQSGAVKAALAARILKRLALNYPNKADAIADSVWENLCKDGTFSNIDIQSLDDATYTNDDLKYPEGRQTWWDKAKGLGTSGWEHFRAPKEFQLPSAAKIVIAYQLQADVPSSNNKKYYVNLKTQAADRWLAGRALHLLDLDSSEVVCPLSDEEVKSAMKEQALLSSGKKGKAYEPKRVTSSRQQTQMNREIPQ